MQTIKEAISNNVLPFEFEGKPYVITEYDQKLAYEQNIKNQKEASSIALKEKARFMAFEFGVSQCKMGEEITDVAEKFYQWLIKDLA